MARQLGIFAKHWQRGQAKTRLAADIGFEAAARFCRLSLEALLRRFSVTADRRLLAFTPADRAGEFAALVESTNSPGRGLWSIEPQTTGNLGARIEHYFASAFAQGASSVVLLGSDSPTLPEPFVREAFDRLSTVDAVAGPTDDGGYYLIGLSRPLPRLFDDIAWSTPLVWEQTLHRLNSERCSYHTLPRWYDVDTFADLVRLGGELTGELPHEWFALQQLMRELNVFPAGPDGA